MPSQSVQDKTFLSILQILIIYITNIGLCVLVPLTFE